MVNFLDKYYKIFVFKCFTEFAKRMERLLNKRMVPCQRANSVCQDDCYIFGSYRYIFLLLNFAL